MPYSIFPSNFIYWTKVQNHQEIKEKYFEPIISSSKSIEKKQDWKCSVSTSYCNDDVNDSLFDEYFLNSVIWKPFDELLSNKPFYFDTPKESLINGIWYNTYVPGQYQEIHQHSSSDTYKSQQGLVTGLFSGIYLIDLQEKNKTVFYQPGPLPCMTFSGSISMATEHIEEGNVIFFPSGLSHYVLPAEKSRTTISFNILSVF